MNTGQYNTRITFKATKLDKTNVTTNEFGEEILIDSPTVREFNRWAKVINKSATFVNGQNPTTRDVLEIRCNYSKAINDNMKIVIRNVEYEIETVIDYDMTRKEYVIIAYRNKVG